MLPSPIAYFPFTSPPTRHLVPSRFERPTQETREVSVMEGETGGLLFSSSVNNVSQQLTISTVSLSQASSVDERLENKIDTVTAANDLLENGILVETNKGLVNRMIHD